jgi:hypothetical protein
MHAHRRESGERLVRHGSKTTLSAAQGQTLAACSAGTAGTAPYLQYALTEDDHLVVTGGFQGPQSQGKLSRPRLKLPKTWGPLQVCMQMQRSVASLAQMGGTLCTCELGYCNVYASEDCPRSLEIWRGNFRGLFALVNICIA